MRSFPEANHFLLVREFLQRARTVTADGGRRNTASHFWQTLLSETETLDRHLKSKRPSADEVIGTLQRLEDHVTGYQGNKREKVSLGETLRIIQSIVNHLYYEKQYAPSMRSAMVYAETRVSVELLPTIRRFAGDGGQKTSLNDARKGRRKGPEFWRKWNLYRQLRRQHVEIEGGLLGLLVETIKIEPEVDLSKFRDGAIDANTKVMGKSKIGARAHLSGSIEDSDIGEEVEIVQGIKVVDSTIGRGTRLERSSVIRYNIGEDLRITGLELFTEGESTFGNGTKILLGAEKEGKRDLLIYDGLTLEEAEKVVMERGDHELLESYRQKVTEYEASTLSDRGHVVPMHSRTSVRRPLIAAAAAMMGDIRWVLTPRPCRPSKFRFDVDATRSPERATSPFMPTHIEQPESRH